MTRWTPPVDLSPREERLCARLAKHRRFYRFLRLYRHRLFDDGFQTQLAALYADRPRGTPPLPPARLAAVVLLQAYAQASDEDAVQLAETDLRWQLVLDCLGADEAPFGKTTLVDFRTRLVAAGFHTALLRRTVALAAETKAFGPRQAAALRVAVDSAPLEGAGKVEDTLNLLGRALRLLAGAMAAVLGLGAPQLVADAGLEVLAAKSIKAGLDLGWARPGEADRGLGRLVGELERLTDRFAARAPRGLGFARVEAARELASRVLGQDAERGPDGAWRVRAGVAPDRLIALSDPAMRHGRKSASVRIDGYKTYVACELDRPLVLAACARAADAPEAQGADALRAEVEAHGPVAELAVDRAFLPSAWAADVAAAPGGRVVCRPYALPNGERFSKHDFRLDLVARSVRCPAGHERPLSGEQVLFPTSLCAACPLRPRCQPPGAKRGRTLQLHADEPLMQRLAAEARTAPGRAKLRERTAVEHALAHHVRRRGARARYRGVVKNTFDACRVAAVENLLAIDRGLRAQAAAAA